MLNVMVSARSVLFHQWFSDHLMVFLRQFIKTKPIPLWYTTKWRLSLTLSCIIIKAGSWKRMHLIRMQSFLDSLLHWWDIANSTTPGFQTNAGKGTCQNHKYRLADLEAFVRIACTLAMMWIEQLNPHKCITEDFWRKLWMWDWLWQLSPLIALRATANDWLCVPSSGSHFNVGPITDKIPGTGGSFPNTLPAGASKPAMYWDFKLQNAQNLNPKAFFDRFLKYVCQFQDQDLLK